MGKIKTAVGKFKQEKLASSWNLLQPFVEQFLAIIFVFVAQSPS